MPEPISALRQLLNTAQQRIDAFKQQLDQGKGQVSQQNIDAFIMNLRNNMELLKDAHTDIKGSEITPMNDIDSLEERIVSAISSLQQHPRSKDFKGTVGDRKVVLAEFLNQMKEQVKSFQNKLKSERSSGKKGASKSPHSLKDALHTTHKGLEAFSMNLNQSEGKVPQKQIDAFFNTLQQNMDLVEEAHQTIKGTPSSEMDEGNGLEERILKIINSIQRDPRAKLFKGNVGNVQVSLTEFLGQVKEQFKNLKKKSKVERAGKVEYEQL